MKQHTLPAAIATFTPDTLRTTYANLEAVQPMPEDLPQGAGEVSDLQAGTIGRPGPTTAHVQRPALANSEQAIPKGASAVRHVRAIGETHPSNLRRSHHGSQGRLHVVLGGRELASKLRLMQQPASGKR